MSDIILVGIHFHGSMIDRLYQQVFCMLLFCSLGTYSVCYLFYAMGLYRYYPITDENGETLVSAGVGFDRSPIVRKHQG